MIEIDSHPHHSAMRTSLLCLSLALVSCGPQQPLVDRPAPLLQEEPAVGVLVMAHGGSPEWNDDVARAVAPLAAAVPTSVAYGMADPSTMSAALDSLRDRGIQRVAVVRMFLSGESFAEQTHFYLGLSETPPESFVLMGPRAADPAARLPIGHTMRVATHPHGLLNSLEAREIAVERAGALSSQPSQESVLLLAHGMGAEDENDRVLEAMHLAADLIRAQGFAEVEVATLREDWLEQRLVAEAGIRQFVADQAELGRTVIVIPMRLSGFGPYGEVLAGLPFLPGDGLLPHDLISRWLRRTATDVSCSAGWGSALGPCDVLGTNPTSR